MRNTDSSHQGIHTAKQRIQISLRPRTLTKLLIPNNCCGFHSNFIWTNTMISLMHMSELFSKKQYHNQLRNFSKVCTSEHLIQSLTKKSKTDGIKNFCRPMAIAESQNWKFSIQKDSDVEAEEVVLCIQGIICNRELPPIQKPSKV